jgi:hypothetical protein
LLHKVVFAHSKDLKTSLDAIAPGLVISLHGLQGKIIQGCPNSPDVAVRFVSTNVGEFSCEISIAEITLLDKLLPVARKATVVKNGKGEGKTVAKRARTGKGEGKVGTGKRARTAGTGKGGGKGAQQEAAPGGADDQPLVSVE